MLTDDIVGKYVRNKYGIAKVLELSEDVVKGIQTIKFDRPITPNIDLDKIEFGELIDLIEVGDYVNSKKVTKINLDKTMNGETAILCGDSNYDCLDVIYKNCDIKSIVTHEQMEAMEYKIER